MVTPAKSKYSAVALGGILTAVVVLLAFVGGALSFIDILLYLAVTPIAIAGVRGGLWLSVQVCIASFVIIGAVQGFFPSALFFLISTAPLGIALGHLFRKQSGPGTIMIVSALCLAVGIGASVMMGSAMTGISIEQDITKMAEMFHIAPQHAIKQFFTFLPAILFITALCYAIYIWLFNEWILERLHIVPAKQEPILPRIRHILFYPQWLSYLFLFALVGAFMSKYVSQNLILQINLNILFVLSFMFYFKGIFVTKGVLIRFLPKIAAILVNLLIITLGYPLAILLGFYFCLRKDQPIIIARKASGKKSRP